MNKTVRKIFDILNWMAIIGLLLVYLASQVDPQDFWPIAFFGLSYKFWLGLNVLLLSIWILLKRKRWIYNALVIAAGFQFIAREVQFNNKVEDTPDFKVCSFNTNVQKVYNEGNTSDEIDYYLNANDVDVGVMIEWLNKKGSISSENYPFQQFVRLNAEQNRYDYGLKLVSKYPIINWEKVRFNHFTNNMSVVFDIEIKGEIIRFIATHLQSNNLSSKDYHTMLNVEAGEEYQDYAKNIMSRIKSAVQVRSNQVKTLLETIEESPYPVIILGDFNDTPQSYAYQQLRSGRKDAFVERGSGWGATYLKPFPLLRIDYILYDNDFSCVDYNSTNEIVSDHKLIEATFKIN
ncbi:MAG: endonuclease/exonuclease/phosphatase family protein [Bacteroidia bacterium]|nr:endonuclease/exonuclease/phosphatase family protein [Bacteroidia bacterium]NNJ54497.1 hypothetical protein [Bacteroidia bacterium]